MYVYSYMYTKLHTFTHIYYLEYIYQRVNIDYIFPFLYSFVLFIIKMYHEDLSINIFLNGSYLCIILTNSCLCMLQFPNVSLQYVKTKYKLYQIWIIITKLNTVKAEKNRCYHRIDLHN